eukprot:221764-Pyramimonas_sp.AAC.1
MPFSLGIRSRRRRSAMIRYTGWERMGVMGRISLGELSGLRMMPGARRNWWLLAILCGIRSRTWPFFAACTDGVVIGR